MKADGNEDERIIQSVTGWMMGSERRIRFESDMFIDCTGDGLVGFMAGAKYRIGREAQHEYGESWAPEVADDITLGSTLLFYTKDVGRPVTFKAPSFAKDITQTQIPIKRVIRSGDSGCHYWWIEWGGEKDIVHDNEQIRDELWSVIYGIWDYIKNCGQFPDSANMTLEWVGAIPGKREYRRFIGEYVLDQNDIIAQSDFEDRIAFGGWSIDLHPPQGMYATESGSKHLHADGIYHIPFRSVYSVNVSNLLFAGRNISATHVAFGTTRVMATCAVIGEAAGTGAALAVKHHTTPRAIYQEHLLELQQTMLRQDASIIGIRNIDPHDLARKAVVTASSTLTQLNIEESTRALQLISDVGVLIPVIPEIHRMELLMDAEEDTTVELELWSTGRGENYVPHVSASLEDHDVAQPVIQWNMRNLVRQPVCCRISPATEAFQASKVIDGYARPYGEPHMWISEPLQAGQETYLQLHWTTGVVQFQEIHLTFNDDVNEDLINLHHHITPFEVIPELVKSYRIEMLINGAWKVIAHRKNNHKRKQVLKFNEQLATDCLRIFIEETNGSSCAEIVEVRVYS